MMHELRGRFDEPLYRHRVPAERGFAGKRQKLPGEIGGAVGELDDEVEELADALLQSLFSLGERRVPLNAGKEVVELVRHAAGVRADALHLLGMEQLPLDLLPFGDV